MIHPSLLNPRSIAVIGASNDSGKPGGKVFLNIISNGFKGRVYPVNPKENSIQGNPCYTHVSELPQVDLAIIAVAAHLVEETIRILTQKKSCKGFIVFSSGFGEAGEDGKSLEQRCVALVEKAGGTLIGPNCIGLINEHYKGVFAGPIPEYDPKGCDFVSASGATMVFILEEAISRGLKFSTLFSIGNSAQIGVEDILEYWDEHFDPNTSSKIKLLYLEQVNDPARFLKHARSLVDKGCRLAAIKAGSTEEGAQAVSSHTGSLAGSNTAVSALFRKAGVVRCYSRLELVYVAAIFSFPKPKGNRFAVITHAGGPGVMLTDVLTKGGMKVPHLQGEAAERLLKQLHQGSSVANPIDFLATGTAEQLGIILDAVEQDFEEIDGSVVVFGTTGMWSVNNVYQVLHEKINTLKKPIYPILPSVIQAADEVSHFHSKGHINFTDEVSFGYVLSRVQNTALPYHQNLLPGIDHQTIRRIIDTSTSGYLTPDLTTQLLEAAGIYCAKQATLQLRHQVSERAQLLGFPLVMKVVGPLHKSETGGVVLNINSVTEAEHVFEELMLIENATAVLMQQQRKGLEIFIGAKHEAGYGHMILCGLGGVFVEVFKDVSAALSPVGDAEADAMIKRLQSYPMIRGARGKEGVNEELIRKTILHLSALLAAAPEIAELDLNPLMGNMKELVVVDARIRIENLDMRYEI